MICKGHTRVPKDTCQNFLQLMKCCDFNYVTRMHSSRMRTARSLIVSLYLIISHTCPPFAMHAPFATPPLPCMPPLPPPATMHTPSNHACHPPGNHTCPSATMHAPLATMHAPLATMHAPWKPCTPPSPPRTMHAPFPWQPCIAPQQPCMPPCEQNHTHL